MSSAHRPYRGVSAADRHSERRARLLDACLDVVGREGVAATTVGAICDQAGLTKRYFYESFKDRDAILGEVLEGLHSSLMEAIGDALADADDDILARARVAVRLLAFAMDDPRMARLYVEALGDPGLQSLRQRAYEVYARMLARDVFGIEEADAGSHLAALVFVAGTTQATISWLQGNLELSREDLVEELAQLGTRAVEGRAGSDMSCAPPKSE